MGPAVAILMTIAAMGGGAMLLRLAGVDRALSFAERTAWAFALGVGALGWVAFFPLLLQKADATWFGLMCLLLLPGVLLLGRPEMPDEKPARFTAVERLLIALIALIAALDLIEGWAPPADGDSLAYHFALPKLFLGHGGLYFIPRAADGAVPLLQHMTYTVGLGVGGERAMTLWAGISGWGAMAAFYAAVRRHVDRPWALAATLALITVPAAIYAGGTGQTEIRNAGFVLVAAMAAAESVRRGDLRFAALAGLAAGFYAASKYPGLLFLLPLGLVVSMQRRWFAAGVAFSMAAIVAGGQWYAWNWWHTGDPVFPMLYGIVSYPPDIPWNAAQHRFYETDFPASERLLPQTIGWLFAYPIKATFAPTPALESGRTGFGPLLFVLLPFALCAAWRRRDRIARSPLWIYATVAFASYALWFFLGPSQRVRFLLPIYPLALLCVIAAATRSAQWMPAMRRPLMAGFAAVIVLQLGVQGLFSVKYLRYAMHGGDRELFLRENVSHYDSIRWINENLGKKSLVFNALRHVNYLFDVPYFYAHRLVQADIEIRPDNADPALFWRQLMKKGVTHVFGVAPSPSSGGVDGLLGRLIELGCARELAQIPTIGFSSRTLRDEVRVDIPIYSLDPRTCRLRSAAP